MSGVRRPAGRLRLAALVLVAMGAVGAVPGVALAEEPREAAGWSAVAEAAGVPGAAGDAGTLPATDPTPIQAKYAATGGVGGSLGAADGGELCGLAAGGCAQFYDHGVIFWSPATGARAVTDIDVHLRWENQLAEEGSLGYPVTDTFCGLRDDGCGQHFQGGSVYWSPAAPEAVMVWGVMRDAWAAQGWERGSAGYPVAEQFCGLRDGGCGQHFQSGSVYWSPATGAAVVSTRIRDAWAGQGWETGPLGYPTSGTLHVGFVIQDFQGGSLYDTWPAGGILVVPVPLRDAWIQSGRPLPYGAAFCGLRDGGCGQHFGSRSVYASPAGAFAVSSGVRRTWEAHGWETGVLGYPTSPQFDAVSGVGQHFQGGSVYGLRVVPGAIRDEWAAQGWERGPLGMPVAGSFCGLRDGGCGQHFAGGSVYSSPAGTFAVLRPMADAWGRAGWERGALGYPTSDTFCGLRGGGCGQHFQGGSVYRGTASGTGHAVPIAVRHRWAAQGWENGRLGYPTGNAYPVSGGVAQPFQGGTLTVR